MRVPAIYAISVGTLMLVQWAITLAGGQVPELETAPWEITLHLVAEGATAALLLVAGIGLLRNAAWARAIYLVAGGMLLYTVAVSPGYFAQRSQWPPVIMFGTLLVATIFALRRVAMQPQKA